MKISITSDHAGYQLRKIITEYLTGLGNEVENFGPITDDSCDYPDFVHPLCKSMSEFDYGILICGSSNGVSMTANKYPDIRCAIAWNKELAELARLHNDANCIALASRFVTTDMAKLIVNTFINTEFEGGRHERRVEKIKIVEE
jgi:ribose 5-phosphate isomerase B